MPADPLYTLAVALAPSGDEYIIIKTDLDDEEADNLLRANALTLEPGTVMLLAPQWTERSCWKYVATSRQTFDGAGWLNRSNPIASRLLAFTQKRNGHRRQ